MIHYIAFDNQINLFWDKDFLKRERLLYAIYVNGTQCGVTEAFHFELVDLTADREYQIEIRATAKNGGQAQAVERLTVSTKPKGRRIDITKPPYGADGSGSKPCTKAIQGALDDCRKGDTVYFPKGKYITGALDIRSDTEIFLEEGAVLQGSSNYEDYAPKVKLRFEGCTIEKYRGLLNVGRLDDSGAIGCENVTVRGKGRIFGGGITLCKSVIQDEKKGLEEYIASLGDKVKDYERDKTIPGRARPCLFEICNCRNFVLDGLNVGYSACWNVHFTYCENVTVSNCKIQSKGVWNGDGIDPDSSVNTCIYGCEFDTFDDAIAVKSGKNPEGNRINKPCKDIRVFDCFGSIGMAIGSELSGGIENVYVWNCNFYDDPYGFRIKTSRPRGGYVRNVYVDSCAFASIGIDTQYDCNNDGLAADELTRIENIRFSNILLTGLHGSSLPPPPTVKIFGFDNGKGAIEGVELRNIVIRSKTDKEMELIVKNVKKMSVENIKQEQ